MQKIMCSLWKPAGLCSEQWRDELTGACKVLAAQGGQDVHLMLVDAAVAPAAAQRLTSSAEPLDGMLSLWLEDTTMFATMEAVIAQHVAHWHSYHVDEIVPNHERRSMVTRSLREVAVSSVRVPGMCQLALFKRPAQLGITQWLRLWRDVHSFNAYALQSIFDCRQNRVIAALSAGAPEVHAIVEEHYPEAAIGDIEAFYDAKGDAELLHQREQALSESVCSFVDLRSLDCILTSFYQVYATR